MRKICGLSPLCPRLRRQFTYSHFGNDAVARFARKRLLLRARAKSFLAGACRRLFGTRSRNRQTKARFGFASWHCLMGRFTFMPDIGRKRCFHKRTGGKRFAYFSAHTAHIHNRQNGMEAVQDSVLSAHKHSGRLSPVHERRKPRPLAPRKTHRSI